MNTISTIIPVYQDSGLPFRILEETVNSVISQNSPPLEVIISDDSTGESVEKWVKEFNSKSPRPILYVRNSGPKGVSSNSNFGAKLAIGTLIHFLHSDDRLIDRDVYCKVIKAFNEESILWMLLAGQMRGIVTIPNVQNLNLFGVNTVGGPSSIIIHKSCFDGFDEKISLLMDIEFFQRAFKRLGPAKILKSISIEYGSGEWQLTKTIDEKKYSAEIDYLWKNQQIGFLDFLNLLSVKDSWNIKRSAYSFLCSSSTPGRVKKILFILAFNMEVIRFRFTSLKIIDRSKPK